MIIQDSDQRDPAAVLMCLLRTAPVFGSFMGPMSTSTLAFRARCFGHPPQTWVGVLKFGVLNVGFKLLTF